MHKGLLLKTFFLLKGRTQASVKLVTTIHASIMQSVYNDGAKFTATSKKEFQGSLDILSG